MIRTLLFTAALCIFAAPSFAGDKDLTYRGFDQLDTAAAPASGDLMPMYDSSADSVVKFDALATEAVSAANTITTAECLPIGKTFYIDSASGFASTLPDPTLGCKFTFILKTDSTNATNHTIVTDGDNDILGRVFDSTGAATTASASADTITFSSSAALASDRIELWSDGTSWHGIGYSSASGAIAYSSAI